MHLFLNLIDAKRDRWSWNKYVQDLSKRYVIIRCKIKIKDVIMFGEASVDRRGDKSVVNAECLRAKKVKYIERIIG